MKQVRCDSCGLLLLGDVPCPCVGQESARKKIKDMEENDWISILVTISRKDEEKPKQYGVQWLVPEGINTIEDIYTEWLFKQCGGIFERAFRKVGRSDE